jgi:two-component system LytT family sensor kinase
VEKWLHLFLLALLFGYMWLTYPGTLPEDSDFGLLLWTVIFDFIVFAGCTYVAAYVLLPRFFMQGRYARFFWMYLATIIAGTTLILFNDMLLLYNADADQAIQLVLFYGSTLGMIAMISLVGVGLRALFFWLRSVQQLNVLRQEKLQTELAFLRSQLNPHFLFNTLNLLYGHIEKSNKMARSILVQYSDLLRYQLYECDAPFIDIEKEIDFLQNYIDLQKLRKNASLECGLQLCGDLTGFEIAPLLMIPLVENGFKHVGYDGENGHPNFVCIEIGRHDGQFRFRCVNSKAAVATVEVVQSGGLGLQNVRRRLQLIYPDRHELRVEDGPDTFDVQLTIAL